MDEDGREGGRAEQARRLRVALWVTGSVFVVELVGGIVSGSLALLADAAHMLTDLGALAISYGAIQLARRRPTAKHTFGFHRAEILAAFVNAQVLLLVAGLILYEAWERFWSPSEIDVAVMMGVASIGLVANIVSVRLLAAHRHDSLNVRAAYLEVLADTFGSIGVLIAGVVLLTTGWRGVDPLVSVAIACFILPRTIQMLRESAHILLEGAPSGIDVSALRGRLSELPEVVEVHDVHAWTLTSGLHAVSVHVRAAPSSPRGHALNAALELLNGSPEIDHATVQVEWGAEVACETTACAGHEGDRIAGSASGRRA